LPLDNSLAEALTYGDSPHYVRWFIYFLIFDALAAPVFAKLRIENRPVRFVILKFLNIILTAGFILFFIEFLPSNMPNWYESITSFFGMKRQVDFVFLTNLLASAFVLLFMIPELRALKFQFDVALFKKMLWYVVPLVFVAIAGNINQAFAAPLQKYFLGGNITENISNVAVYAAAAKLAILLNLFTSAFNYAAEPFFFNNADNKDSLKIYGKVALAFTIVSCLGALALIFYIDVIILLLGENYRSGINVVPILLFAYIFLGLYYNVSIWYKLKDKTHIGAMISFAGVSSTIVISIILLPVTGAIASAWAALVCYIIMVVIGYVVGQKYYPVAYPVKSILSYIFMTVILAVGSIYLRQIGLPLVYFYTINTLVLSLFLFLLYKREWKDIISQ
jgi:O-antigen/teichoic acid export membrane protein